MKKKFKNISFIVLDVVVLAFFGFYLAINLKYKDADSKEVKATGDFNLQSLLANGSGSSSNSPTPKPTSCQTHLGGNKWVSVGYTSSITATSITPSNASGWPLSNRTARGACSVTGTLVKCNKVGKCYATVTANGTKCKEGSICCCPTWSEVGQRTYSRDISGENRGWADANQKCYHFTSIHNNGNGTWTGTLWKRGKGNSECECCKGDPPQSVDACWCDNTQDANGNTVPDLTKCKYATYKQNDPDHTKVDKKYCEPTSSCWCKVTNGVTDTSYCKYDSLSIAEQNGWASMPDSYCETPIPDDTPTPVYLTVNHYEWNCATNSATQIDVCSQEGPTSKEQNTDYSTSWCSSKAAKWENKSTAGDATSGNMGTSDKHVIYYYQCIRKLTVRHYKEGTTELAPNNSGGTCAQTINESKCSGLTYSTSACPNLKDGWEMTRVTGDSQTGTMSCDKDIEVIYYYREIPKCYIKKSTGDFVFGQYLDQSGTDPSKPYEKATYTNGTEIPESDCYNPTLKFRKISNDTGAPTAGATLKVYRVTDYNGNSIEADQKDEWVTVDANNGWHEITLPVGEYKLYEVKAPNGYILNKHPSTAVITKHKELNPGSAEISVGDWLYKEISFIKIDASTGLPLAGAELAILDKNKNEVHSWISDGTPKKFIDLGPDEDDNWEPGKYYFVEKTAAPGHIIQRDPVVFYILENGNAADMNKTPLSENKFTMANVPCPRVLITKYDKDTGNKLSGAKLRLVDSKGHIVEEWRDAEKEIQVCPDKYHVEEVEAPKYYVPDETKYEFEVREDRTVTPNHIKVYNKHYPEIKIMKSDAKTRLPVQEARLALYKDDVLLTDFHWTVDGNVETDQGYYNPWITNAYPKAFYFGPGTYTVKETSVPEGYIKAPDFTFTVDKNGTPSIIYVDMLDIPYPEVKISKVDAITGEYVAGAKLRLTDYDGNLVMTATDNRYWVDENGDGTVDYFQSTTDGYLTFILKPGTYTLTEVEAPANYVKYSSPVTITVSDDGIINPSAEVKVENVPCPTVSISKQSSTSTNELAGAMIKLTNRTTGEVKYVETDVSPKKVQVCTGTWDMQEINPPVGYVIDPVVKTFVVDENGNTTQKEFIFNDPIYPEISFYKRDRATNEIVSGARLKIEKDDGEVVAEWTSLDVAHKLRLAPGTYKLIEVEAPNGYVKNTEPVVFTVTERADVESREISILDTPYPSVYIAKIDSVTKEPIDGAFMMITDYSGSIIDTWESSPDYHRVVLAPGKYTVTETRSAPNHVLTTDTIEIEVNALGEVIGDFVQEDSRIVFKMENVPYPTVKILKVDEDGNNLPGAKLKLTDFDGNVIDEWITNTKYREFVLGPGKYYLEETQAPTDYIKSNEKIEITVSDQAVASPSEVKMENKKTPTILIDKRDATTNENIAGAELIIRRADNHEIVETFVSATTTHKIKLQPGTYELLENVPPTGYEYNEQIVKFTVDETGSDPSPVVFNNNRLKTISIAKVDSETGSLIAGAVLVVKDMNDVEVARVTSDTRRVILPKVLDAGQYKLIEESAPPHYAKSDEVKLFTVTIDENPVLEIDYANTMMRKLCMIKVDSETGAKVAGARFRLTNKANNQIMLEFDTTSDCYDYEVPYGNYLLEEITPPTHYQKTNQVAEVTINSESPRNIEMKIANPPYRDLSLAKVDTDTGELIPGAKLELTYPDGTKKEIISRTERVIIDDLYYGTYTVQEIEAPEDYKINSQVYTFTVTETSNDVINLDVNNYKLRLISVAKVDSETGEFIPGVTLEIRNAVGTIIDKVVTENVPVVVHDRDNRLDYGIYSIKEEEAPEGYQINSEPTVFVINSETSGDDSNLTVVKVKNTPYRKATICKLDSETLDQVAGAKLELTYPDGTKKEIISEANCTLLSDIVYGEYKLVELEAPEGYDRNTEELTFTVTEDSDRELTWSIKDNPLRDVIIYKVDKENNEKVAGAKFKLTYPDGTEKFIITTVEGVKIEGLKYGIYTLIEVEAPEGYQFNNESKEIVINADSPKEIEVSLENLPYRKVKICKYDTETLRTVDGAKFKLTYPDGTVKEITTTNECTEFDDIVYGEYELREVEAPTGYEFKNDVFAYDVTEESDRELEWSIKNRPLKAICIAVLDDETKVLVPGADVIVKNSKDDAIDDYISGNERECVYKLPYDEYCTKVIDVPDNYQMPKTNPECVTIDDESPEITYVDIPLEPYYKLKVVKYGVDMDTNLAGAKFELRNENDEVIQEFTTDENATYIERLLPGMYYLVEIEAPEGYSQTEERIPVEIVTGQEITEITVIDDVETPITGKTVPYAILSIVLGAFGYACLSISKKSKKYE